MKNLLFTIILLLFSTVIFSQKKLTRTGEINFQASVPAFEEVAAKNKSVTCSIVLATGEIKVLALIKEFKFKIPLMEEHFNENYLESDTYPNATFKGKIVGFDEAKITAGKSSYEVEGDLTMHGVTKKIKTQIIFTKAAKLTATASFNVKASDFKVSIPSVVKSKVSEKIDIDLKFEFDSKI